MAIDFPNSPSPGDNFTVSGKTWTFTDGKWALNVSVGGVQGPAGIAIQGTAPATTDVLWADTSVSGVAVVPAGGTTGQVLAKSSSTSYDTAWATPVTSGDMALKADLASPTFTGTPTLPTGTIATTQTAGNSSTAVATTAFVGTAVANLVDSAPATLNTLDELAAALGDDANFATTTATAIGLKAPLASPTFTGTPTLPTGTIATTQTAGNSTTAVATTAFVTGVVKTSTQMWIPASAFLASWNTIAPNIHGSGWPNVVAAINYPDGSFNAHTSGTVAQITGTAKIEYYYQGGGSGNFKLELYAAVITPGSPGEDGFISLASDMNSTGTYSSFNGLGKAVSATFSVTAGDMIKVTFGRTATDAADTSTNSCYFYGANIVYV